MSVTTSRRRRAPAGPRTSGATATCSGSLAAAGLSDLSGAPGSVRNVVITSVLLLLPSAAALGTLLPGLSLIVPNDLLATTDSFFAFRVLVVILFFLRLCGPRGRICNLTTGSVVCAAGLIWLVFAVGGALFVGLSAGLIRSLSALILGFLLVYSILASPSLRRTLSTLCSAWALAFVVTAVLAIREIVFGVHLSNYLPSYDLSRIDGRLIASSFGNPNNYAAFLVIALPFLIYGVMQAQTAFSKYAFIATLPLLVVLLLYTGSRICLGAVAVQFVLLTFLAGSRFRRLVFLAVPTIFLVIVVHDLSGDRSTVLELPYQADTVSVSDVVGQVVSEDSDTSAGQRANLYRDGLWMIGESGGLGLGSGNFEVEMATADVPFPTKSVLSPHCAYLELAVEYGLLVLVAFMLAAVTCFRRLWTAARISTDPVSTPATILVVAVAGNIISAFAASSYFIGSINWVFLATVALGSCVAEAASGVSRVGRHSGRPAEPRRVQRWAP